MLAIVTGADGGIGTAFCRELARRGWDLVMVSNRGSELCALADELSGGSDSKRQGGVNTFPLVLDLTRPDSTELLLAFLDARGLKADLLINNAGVFDFKEVTNISEKRIDLYVDLHIRSVTTLTRALAIRMKEQGGGRILNMSSLSCWTPMPGIALYSATKAYIRVLSRSMHYELRGTGVTVTACCPGGIATSLFGLPDRLMRLALRLHAVERPEKFVKKALNRALKGRKQYVNGIMNRAAIPLVAIMPGWVRVQVKRWIK